MYTLNLDPIAFELGPLTIRWYGLIYALGFILAYIILYKISKKQLIPNLNKNNVDLFVLYSMISIVLGARIFEFLFYQFNTLITNPLEFFMIWHGGLSFHGALAGFLFSTWIFGRKYKVNFWQLLDISSIIVIFCLIFGRLANWINGELAGTPSTTTWCTIFPNYDAVCRHPYPIYAALSHLLLFLYLSFLVYKNKNNIKDYLGKKKLTINFIIGYGILRIITDIWKLDNQFFGIKTGQWLSLIMILVGVLIIKYRKIKQ